MKKLFVSFLLISSIFASCKKDDSSPVEDSLNSSGSNSLIIEKKNRAAIVYFNADWCTSCGYFGKPLFDSIMKYESSGLIAMKSSSSSNNTSLNWFQGGAIWTFYVYNVFGGVNGIPSFAVNTTQQTLTSDLTNNFKEILNKATLFKTSPVKAGIGLKKSIVNDSIFVETGVQFYNAISSNEQYSLALYLVEDSVNAYQSGPPNIGNIHRNVIRATFSNSYLGNSINLQTAYIANHRFENSYKLYLNPSWDKSKLKVVGIVWNMGTTPATIVNSNVVL